MSNYSNKNPRIPEGINSSDENPLKEFLILAGGISLFVISIIVALSFAANHLAVHIPFSWEKEAASKSEILSNLYTTNSKNSEDQETLVQHQLKTEKLQQLMNQLIKHANLPESMSITVHYIDENVPNAFATLGGHIFIYQGLIDQIDSENALAMVMAHELAHIKHRHPIQALSKGILIQFFLAAILGNNNQMQALIGNTGLLTLLHFNREMEKTSDQEALKILHAYYGHTQGAENFFVKMLGEHNNPDWQAVFATHPDLDHRIDDILTHRGNNRNGDLTALDPIFISSEEK